eukprot:7783097-Pyramimonas_sp.AAC.1
MFQTKFYMLFSAELFRSVQWAHGREGAHWTSPCGALTVLSPLARCPYRPIPSCAVPLPSYPLLRCRAAALCGQHSARAAVGHGRPPRGGAEGALLGLQPRMHGAEGGMVQRTTTWKSSLTGITGTSRVLRTLRLLLTGRGCLAPIGPAGDGGHGAGGGCVVPPVSARALRRERGAHQP